MPKTVFCSKLNEEAEALSKAPIPGPLGEKILNHISKPAWNMWVSHQTMLINEYRLSMVDPKAREFLREEMEKFFFGEGSEAPSGFNPES